MSELTESPIRLAKQRFQADAENDILVLAILRIRQLDQIYAFTDAQFRRGAREILEKGRVQDFVALKEQQ